MSTAKELYDAAMLLKENCKNAKPKNQICFLENGEKCPFNYVENGLGLCCLAEDREPIGWNIKKPRRFTDEEVALAKAFKSIGAVEARRNKYDVHFYDKMRNILSAISLEFFMGIGDDSISVDEIIKDGDEE